MLLSRAAENGHEVVIKLPLDSGRLSVSLKDYTGRAPLIWATGSGHAGLVRLFLQNCQVDVN